jgi:hypothetical protein
MMNYTIPENQWTSFFDHLNHDMAGWSATIRMLQGQGGARSIVRNLPFQGISFDTKGSRSNSVQISVGDELGRHFNHVVDLPLHIRERQDFEGAIDVQIEPANGPVTLIHLRGPVQ